MTPPTASDQLVLPKEARTMQGAVPSTRGVARRGVDWLPGRQVNELQGAEGGGEGAEYKGGVGGADIKEEPGVGFRVHQLHGINLLQNICIS